MTNLRDGYTAFIFGKDLTPASLRFYRERLGLFFAHCEGQGVSTVEGLTADLIRRYIRGRRDTGRSYGTLRADTRAIKSFLNFQAAEGLVDPGLPKRIEMPRADAKVVEVFTPMQIAALLARAQATDTPRRDTAILLVLLDTGLRASELCGLTLSQVHLSVDDSYLLLHGKGRKSREVGLGKKTRAALNTYLTRERPKDAGETVFLSRRHRPLTVLGLDRLIGRLRDAAGGALFVGIRCSAHTFRHTFAVSYLEQGGDVYRLSRLLGHASITTTEVYLRAFQARAARTAPSTVVDALVR